jgi:DNA polymerase III delta prime subunit
MYCCSSTISESEEENQGKSIISLLSSSCGEEEEEEEEEHNHVIAESSHSNSETDSTQIETTSNKNSTKVQQEKENQHQKWACRRCTFLNDPQKNICELCEFRQHSSSLRASSHQQSLQSSKAQELKKIQDWDCIESDSDSDKAPTVQRSDHRTSVKPLPSSGSSSSFRQNTLDFQVQARRTQGIKRRLTKRSFPSATPPPKAKASENNMLWIDKYLPKSMDDLCIPKKKAQEIYDWLYDNTNISSSPTVHGKKRLLFLCGPPGVGKSTALRCIAKTLNIHIKEWHDVTSLGRIGYDPMLKDDFVSQSVGKTSTIDDLIDFMNRSVNYTALPLMAHTRRNLRQLKNASVSHQQHRQIVLIDHLPKSLLENNSSYQQQSHSITSPHIKFQQLLQQYIEPLTFASISSHHHHHQYPLVIFYNEIKENSRVDLKQMGRVFSDQVVLSPFTSILQVKQVTSSQMKKILSNIIHKEKKQMNQKELDQIIENSHGDLRHAINMVQVINHPIYQFSSFSKRKTNNSNSSNCKRRDIHQQEQQDEMEKKKKKDSNKDLNQITVGRDTFYSELHLVGKLVHAKKPHTTQIFEQIHASIASSAMEVDAILAFMQENCIDHYTEIDELSKALEIFSFSSKMICHSFFQGENGNIFFQQTKNIVTSLIARSIALTNDHPAPSKFRPIRKPKMYSIFNRALCHDDNMKMTNGSRWIHRSSSLGRMEVDSFKQLMPSSLKQQEQDEQLQVEIGFELETEDEIEDFSE